VDFPLIQLYTLNRSKPIVEVEDIDGMLQWDYCDLEELPLEREGEGMKTENWIHGWLKSIWEKRKAVPDYRKEYPYNIEFGDGRTKKEMDKMQNELNKDKLKG